MRAMGLIWIAGCAAFAAGQAPDAHFAPLSRPAAQASARPLVDAPAGRGIDRGISEVVREIDDPSTGRQWLLERDSNRPGGPGHLVLAGESSGSQPSQRAGSAPGSSAAVPVIRAGDRLVVEEDTPLVEARLEAVALNAAMAGALLKVRLAIGGRVVSALAVAPGRAELAPGSGLP
jgi:hypothetical protein